MENSRSSKTGGSSFNRFKIFLYNYLKKSDIEYQELNKNLIRDNMDHMFIVSIILILISAVKIILKINQSWAADIGIEMLFISIIFLFIWVLVRNNLIQGLKTQKIINISFWLLVNIVGLKELYTEIEVYNTLIYYYLLMYLLTGFYIGSFIDIVFFVGFDAIITIIMVTSISNVYFDTKLYVGITILVALISTIIMTSRFYHYILEKKEQFAIRTLGGVDRLTNLLNRRGFDEKLAQIWGQWSDVRKTIIAIMIDIDYFKNYNDTFGHIAGDQCLKDICECIYDIASRKTDLIVRYGGEEIVIVLSNQKEEECEEIALHIQERINLLHIKAGENATYPNVTISIGIASMTANPNNTIYDLIEKADEQLYYSKNSGRNKITMDNVVIELNKVRVASMENKSIETLSKNKEGT